MTGLQSAEALFLGLFDAAMTPPPAMNFAEWLPANIVLIDGEGAGRPWSAHGAPYLVEIAESLSEDSPCNRVTVRKSQQTGASILAMAWSLYIADRMPANTLYAVPGLDALRDLSGQKLGPLMRAWERRIGRRVFAPQTARSGEGSTTHEKRFGDSYLGLANANSKMDLSSKTCRFGIKDEVSKWARLQTGEDPETLFEGRFTAFQRKRNWKILEISTPEVDTGDESGMAEGHCRVDRAFKASDRRFWHLPCPECGALFFHEPAGFVIDYAHPHRSRYACPHCGHHVSERERVPGVRAGRWLPTAERDGRHRGYHIDGFVSLMMSYEVMAEKAIRAERGTEGDRKDYYNLDCGLPFRFRGDAPDHKRLYERREPFKRYHVPAPGLFLVAAADVQLRGIWLEIIAIAPDRQTWVVDATYIEGDTSSPDNDVFKDLTAATLDKQFPDAFGGLRTVDALAIDTGYRAHVVYAWARKKQRAHPVTGKRVVIPVKGIPGWGKPAIGQPAPQTIDLDGQKVRAGALLWNVGTWSLKSGFYTDLHKTGLRSGEAADPPGLCHFGDWQDEAYFKQITAEHLEDVIVKGVVTERVWKRTADNHFLDCRVYNLALAEYLGISTLTRDEWAEWVRLRGVPPALTETDLFAPRPRLPIPQGEDAQPAEPAPAPRAPVRRTYFDRISALND